MTRTFWLLAGLVFLPGCATQVIESQTLSSYQVGVVKEVAVGDPLIVDQRGQIEKVRHWVGILNSPDGWKTENRYSADWLRRELLYAGKSGSTIEINYREFRGGLAAQPFYQTVKYDLNESQKITFRRFVIDVIQADNHKLVFRIVNDR